MKPYVNNEIRNAFIAWLCLTALPALMFYLWWRHNQ